MCLSVILTYGPTNTHAPYTLHPYYILSLFSFTGSVQSPGGLGLPFSSSRAKTTQVRSRVLVRYFAAPHPNSVADRLVICPVLHTHSYDLLVKHALAHRHRHHQSPTCAVLKHFVNNPTHFEHILLYAQSIIPLHPHLQYGTNFSGISLKRRVLQPTPLLSGNNVLHIQVPCHPLCVRACRIRYPRSRLDQTSRRRSILP